MPIWPFGRRSRRRKKGESSDAPPTTSAVPRLDHPDLNPEFGLHTYTTTITSGAASRTSTPSRLRRHFEKRSRSRLQETRDSTQSPALRQTPTPQPPSNLRFNRSSDDLTALPPSRGIQASPHLRPVSDPRQNVLANQPRNNTFPGNLPRQQKRKTTDQPPGPVRRQSSKRRKEDSNRVQDLRASSQPPQRPATFQLGSFTSRRRSKRTNTATGAPPSSYRPPSVVSNIVEDSTHSSMSGISEQRTFIVHGLGAFSPRPQVRYSANPHYAYGAGGIIEEDGEQYRSSSRREKKHPAMTMDNVGTKRTVDELADDLDATGIRALMERDARRRDKRRVQDEERIQRKLRKRADLAERTTGRPSSRGLGEEERGDLAVRRRQKKQQEAAQALDGVDPITPRQRSTKNTEEIEAIQAGRYIGDAKTEPMPINPFLAAGESGVGVAMSDFAAQKAEAKPAAVNATPQELEGEEVHELPADSTPPADTSPEGTPMETPYEVATAKAVRLSQPNMTISPPGSPPLPQEAEEVLAAPHTQSEAEREKAPTPNLGEVSTIDIPSPPPPISERTSRASSSPRRAAPWSSFFRRSTKRSSNTDRGSQQSPSTDASFTRMSREGTPRSPLPLPIQSPPPTSANATVRRSSTPHRTQSKFREDLPELPLSPPDSRVQSPETLPTAAAAAATVTTARRGKASLGTIETAQTSPFSDPAADSPPSPLPRRGSSALVSQSLASVDSEGSWLSGKPSRRQSKRESDVSGLGRVLNSGNRSYEDLGMADEDVVRGSYLNSRSHGSPDPTSSPPLQEEEAQATAGAAASEGLTIHSGSKRQPTVVHQKEAHQSRSALDRLVTTATAGQVGEMGQTTPTSPHDDEPNSPTSPTSAITATDDGTDVEGNNGDSSKGLQEARTLNLGRQHSRHISAGSAKLLDIPARDPKRGSMSTQPDTPRLDGGSFPTTPQL